MAKILFLGVALFSSIIAFYTKKNPSAMAQQVIL